MSRWLVQGHFKPYPKVRRFSRELRGTRKQVRILPTSRLEIFFTVHHRLFALEVYYYYLYPNDCFCRCQRNACRSSPNTTPQPNSAPTSSQSANEFRMPVSTHAKNKSEMIQPYNARSLPPPELPPRATSPASALSASWHGQRQRGHDQNPPPRPTEPPPTVPSVTKSHASAANVG